MKRLLQTGTSLVVDRYAFSGVAFTAAKSVSILLYSVSIIISLSCASVDKVQGKGQSSYM